MLIPYVIDQVGNGERTYDIYSRLLEDRIIFIGGEITNELANSVIAQLLYLEAKDDTKHISIYINSNGGVIDAGLAIIDTMNYVKCEVRTICVGMCASMAAVILASGEKGKRSQVQVSIFYVRVFPCNGQRPGRSGGILADDLQIRLLLWRMRLGNARPQRGHRYSRQPQVYLRRRHGQCAP